MLIIRGDILDSQEWSNWITGAGVVVNAALTCAIIYLTYKTAGENKRSANAAENSAKSAEETFELTKEMMVAQKSKEQRIWDSYRRFYGKKIVDHSIGCVNSLIYAFGFNESARDYSMLKAQKEGIDILQEQLYLYFETHEVDRLFNNITAFSKLKYEFQKEVDYNGFDWNKASAKASMIMNEFQDLNRIYDVQ
jgi:hypothetical protein